MIGLIALAGVLTIYLPSTRFDLYADDFVSLRPWLPDALWPTFTGTWQDYPDAPGFYRPVSTLYYALAFYLFGLNSAPLHILPFLVVPLCGWLVGVVVWRETVSRAAAATGALLYVIHPGTTTAVGPWIANQYHGFATILALVALTLWQRYRTRPLAAWTPLAVPLILAGFTKEDALMLPLVIVTAQWTIARWTGTTPAPTRGVVLAAVGLFAAMNGWRWLMLGEFGGYWWPEPRDLVLNLLRGPYYILLVQLGAPVWAATATAASLLCLVASAAGVWRDPSAPTTRVALIGLVILLLCNVPLILMTSMARGHLLTLGAVLMLTAGVMTLGRWARGTRARIAGSLAFAIMVVTFIGTSRDRLQIYAPCSEESRAGDIWVRGDMLPYLAPEFGPWLDARITSCDPATYRPLVETLPVVTWPLVSGGATLLVTDAARAVTLRVRAEIATPTSPAAIHIVINGRKEPGVVLTSSEWIDVPVALQASWVTPFRRSHRIEVRSTGVTDVEVRTRDVIY